MKSVFACKSKLNSVSFCLLVDLIFMNESMRSQIEYSETLARTIESHAFQFFETLSLNSRFVFDIVLRM